MVVSNKYVLYIAIPASALSIFLLIVLLGPFNNDNFSTVDNNDNFIDNNQEISNEQLNEQKEIDDYSLRGAVSSTSGGKQVLEEYKTHLCGGSFEKRTKYIQEHTMPFPCSQPVGITVHQELQENNKTGPPKVWIAATAPYFIVQTITLRSFSTNTLMKRPRIEIEGLNMIVFLFTYSLFLNY